MKRMQLMMKQRIHQEIPPSERCSLQEERSVYQGCNCLGDLKIFCHVPADVLRVGSIRDTPVMHMKNLTQLRRPRLLSTPAPLNLTCIKVLQNTVKKQQAESTVGGGANESKLRERLQTVGGTSWCSGGGRFCLFRTYMAVMASFWKVTKAMPRGLVWTFSFSFLYSSFSLTSLLV